MEGFLSLVLKSNQADGAAVSGANASRASQARWACTSGGQSAMQRAKAGASWANSAREAGAGFGYDTNRVTILAKDGSSETTDLLPKTAVADLILDRIEALL